MAGLSKYEKVVLGLTAGFVLFTGGWLWMQGRDCGDYQVTTLQRQPYSENPTDASEQAGEAPAWPDSLLPGEQIDINTADIYDLQRLPGIGERRAEDIIAYRESNGPFESVDELDEVPGIGTGILDGLSAYACVGQG